MWMAYTPTTLLHQRGRDISLNARRISSEEPQQAAKPSRQATRGNDTGTTTIRETRGTYDRVRHVSSAERVGSVPRYEARGFRKSFPMLLWCVGPVVDASLCRNRNGDILVWTP